MLFVTFSSTLLLQSQILTMSHMVLLKEVTSLSVMLSVHSS